MAQHATVICPPGVWTQLTNGDASGDLSVELLSHTECILAPTTGATEPATEFDASFTVQTKGDGWDQATLVEIFPGVAGAVRLWAKPYTLEAKFAVSHG